MPKSGSNAISSRPRERSEAGPGTERKQQPGLRIRRLTGADLAAVLSVERRSFSSPWSVGMLALELDRPSGVALVAELGGQVVGCAIATRYDQVWHLMKIAVDPDRRRRGIATLLLEAVLGRIDPGVPVTLEVRPTNLGAIGLYERFGFVSFGRRPGYYPDNGEDALMMWRGDPALAGVPVESLGQPESER